MGKVYLIMSVDEHGNEKFKIGTTKRDVITRIKELQTGNSNVISVLNQFQTLNYKHVEKWLHRKYSHQKTETKNEWFTLTNEQVGAFIETCKEVDNTITFMMENNPFFK
jgi:hypothetical protein